MVELLYSYFSVIHVIGFFSLAFGFLIFHFISTPEFRKSKQYAIAAVGSAVVLFLLFPSVINSLQ